MRRLTVLLAIVMVAACGTTMPPTSPGGPSVAPGSSQPRPSDPVASPPVASPAPTDAAPNPTDPLPSDEPPEPDPAAFLQVCRRYDGPLDEAPVPCEDAVRAALLAESVTSPTRVEVRYACGGVTGCAGPDPDRAYVTVVADGTVTEVEVTRGAEDAVEATASRPGVAPSPPAFTPPAAGRASLPGAPTSVASRTSYPLCGEEETPMGGPYDEAARTCFLAGVLAGSPVEFASMGSGTEGQRYAHLYRSSGAGGVEFVTGEGDAWLRTFTGIGEATGGLVFDIDGMSTLREPVP